MDCNTKLQNGSRFLWKYDSGYDIVNDSVFQNPIAALFIYEKIQKREVTDSAQMECEMITN